MAQIYPNTVGKGQSGLAPAAIQTKRLAVTMTGATNYDVTWEIPFLDANYAVVVSVEEITGSAVTYNGVVARAADKITVSLAGSNGQQIVIHAVAFHDC